MAGARTLVIGTRGSELALWQSNAVADMLRRKHPDLTVELKIVKTKGDKILDVALSKIGDKGLFTKELEHCLFDGTIDLAVHSLKDMQTVLPEGLSLASITERESPEDALVAPPGTTIENLPQGGTVATGSLRRRAQLLHLRPDLTIVDVRGTVQTRLKKFDHNGWDGIILARAGLERMELDGRIAQVISPMTMVPAVGQGAFGVEIREGDEETAALVQAIEHSPTRYRSEAERAFLRRLEGGCQAPIGAYAVVVGDRLTLVGILASLDGTKVIRMDAEGPLTEAESVGTRLAEAVIADGGDVILEEVRNAAE